MSPDEINKIHRDLVSALHLEYYELHGQDAKRNQRQNAIARQKSTATLLRQFAIYNGVYPPRSTDVNFGFIKTWINESEIYFGVKVVDGAIPVPIQLTKSVPIMLLNAYVDSYIQERRQDAVGMILYYGKIRPLMFTLHKGLYIGDWAE